MFLPKADTVRRALFESAVIAVGVFLALAADNWNDNRKERQLEQDFLDGIALDLRINNEGIGDTIEQAASLKASIERVVVALQSGEASWEKPSDFVRDLVFCTYLGIPELSSVTYDELRSTGSMRLIKDQEFKRSLADYYSTFDRASQFHSEYRRKEAAVEEALLGLLPLYERLTVSEEDGTCRTPRGHGVGAIPGNHTLRLGYGGRQRIARRHRIDAAVVRQHFNHRRSSGMMRAEQ